MPRLKTVVMVPKGAEFKAVQRGLRRSKFDLSPSRSHGNQATKFLDVISLPVGPNPVKAFLHQWCLDSEDSANLQFTRVIVMGLCGSLTPTLTVGDTVLYRQCVDAQSIQSEHVLACSTDLPLDSAKDSISSVTLVTGVTCERVVSKVVDKHHLGQRFQAQVVDMEGCAALKALNQKVKAVSMLRVVSDDAEHDLPSLEGAFDPEGNIRPWIMARQFLKQPGGAVRLIGGSIFGLRKLEQIAQELGNGLSVEEGIDTLPYRE